MPGEGTLGQGSQVGEVGSVVRGRGLVRPPACERVEQTCRTCSALWEVSSRAPGRPEVRLLVHSRPPVGEH